MEFVVLVALCVLGGAAMSNPAWGRNLMLAVYGLLFLGIAALLTVSWSEPWFVVSFVLVVAGNARLLLTRDRFVERELLWTRCVIGFVAAWSLLFAAGVVLGDALGLEAWGFLYYGLAGAGELFGVLRSA
jgi:hypothetical protein